MKASRLIPLIFILISCQEQKEIPLLSLSDVGASQEIKLSDLMDVQQVVPLETNDSILLPAYLHIEVGDTYFIITTQTTPNKIMQFGFDGKYTKTLAKQGPGPEEYKNANAQYIDKGNNIFIFLMEDTRIGFAALI